jgi:hypothetical protein
MTNDRRLRRRVLIVGLLFFAAFVAGGALAPTQRDRIAYSALQMSLALCCFGSVAWLTGRDILTRDAFTWRGITYRGPRLRPFGHAWMMFGVMYWVLAVALVWMWVSAR